MFYGQCWKCGERWELGTASACKCPDEEPVKFAFRENNDSTEVLRVTPEGEFIWHEDADRMIEEGDFSQSPALPHILKVLRKQRHEQEPVAWLFQHDETGRMNYVSNDGIHDPTMFLGMNPRYALVCPLYTTPPQRKPQYDKTKMNCFVQDLYDKKIQEGKHGQYEVVFHVVHRAIEAAHGIKE